VGHGTHLKFQSVCSTIGLPDSNTMCYNVVSFEALTNVPRRISAS
jgi:hypothetical protein